jgi:hypothetical protein
VLACTPLPLSLGATTQNPREADITDSIGSAIVSGAAQPHISENDSARFRITGGNASKGNILFSPTTIGVSGL